MLIVARLKVSILASLNKKREKKISSSAEETLEKN